MRKYFLLKNGEQLGPFTSDEMGEQNIRKTTPVWYEGLEDWTIAQNVDELKQFFPVTPPPFKSATPPPISPAMPDYPPYPDEKKQNPAIKKALIIGASVLILGIAIYLIFSNINSNRELPDSSYPNTETSNSSDNNKPDPTSNTTTSEATTTTQQVATPPQPDPVTLQNREYRNNWKNYITLDEPVVKGVDYTFGGMTGVDVTVNNSTDYTMDEVVVEVYYIRKNGETWKTETVHVQNIHPGGAEMATAPSSPNGVRATAQIVSITCKRMHFCYDWNTEVSGSDPYYCQ